MLTSCKSGVNIFMSKEKPEVTPDQLVLISRTKINQDKWNKFKTLASMLGLTRDQLLDKVITSTLNSFKLEKVG